MEPAYLRSFLGHDFSVQCRKDFYCFTCQRPFCSHCCPHHRAHHHQPQQRVAQIRYIGGRTMISAQDTSNTRVGFNFQRIQWIRHQGDRWMYLQRPEVALPYPGYEYYCNSCHDKNKRDFNYCAVACQVNHDDGANGIILAQNLVAADWGRQDTNAYCTRCSRAICTALCHDHLECHHVNQTALLIPVFRQDSWFLVQVDEHAIPAILLDGVQTVIVDGVPMHPIRNRPPQLQIPAIAGWNHTCSYAPCMEGIPHAAEFCSIRCHLYADDAAAA